MAETIMPAFNDYPREGVIVGRLLSGYGELELELAKCVAAVTGDVDATIREIFSRRGAEKRLELADNAAENAYLAAGLGSEYLRAFDDMDHCRLIRNQYAHCFWYPHPKDGLGFVDLEELARRPGRIWPLEDHRRLIDVALLEHQEAFFKYAQKCFWYLESEYNFRVKGAKDHIWTLPAELSRPAKHK